MLTPSGFSTFRNKQCQQNSAPYMTIKERFNNNFVFNNNNSEAADNGPAMLIYTAREVYERNLSVLVAEIYQRIQDDELVDTMKQDQASQDFVQLRVKEIISEQLQSESEQSAERLLQKIHIMQQQFEKVEQCFELERRELTETTQTLMRQINESSTAAREVQQQNEFYQQQINKLQEQLNEASRNTEQRVKQREQHLAEGLNEALAQGGALKSHAQELEAALRQKESQVQQLNQDVIELNKRLQVQEQIQMQDKQHKTQEKQILQTQIESLKAAVAEAENSLRVANSREVQLQQEISTQQRQIQEAAVKREELQCNLAQAEQYSQEKVHQERENCKTIIEQLKIKSKEKIHKIKTKAQEFKDTAEQAAMQIVQLQNELEREKQNLSRILDAKQNALQELKQKQDHAARQLAKEHEGQLNLCEQKWQQIVQGMEIKAKADQQELLKQLQTAQRECAMEKASAIEHLQKEITQIQQSMAIQQMQLQEKDSKIGQLEQTTVETEQRLQQQLEIANQKLHEVENSNQNMQEKMNRQKEDINSLINNNTQLEYQSREEKIRAGQLQKEKDKAIDEIKKIFGQLEAARKSIKQLQDQLSVKENSLQAFNQERHSDTQQTASLKRELQLQQSTVQQLRENNELLNRQIGQMEQELNSEHTRVETLTQKLRENDQDSKSQLQQQRLLQEALQQDSEKKQQEISKLNDKIIEVFDKLEAEKNIQTELITQLKIVENKLVLQSTELESSQQQKSSLLKTITELETLLHDKNNNSDALQQQQARLLKERNALQLQLQSVEAQMKNQQTAAKSTLRTCQAHIQQLRLEQARLKENAASSQKYYTSELQKTLLQLQQHYHTIWIKQKRLYEADARKAKLAEDLQIALDLASKDRQALQTRAEELAEALEKSQGKLKVCMQELQYSEERHQEDVQILQNSLQTELKLGRAELDKAYAQKENLQFKHQRQINDLQKSYDATKERIIESYENEIAKIKVGATSGNNSLIVTHSQITSPSQEALKQICQNTRVNRSGKKNLGVGQANSDSSQLRQQQQHQQMMEQKILEADLEKQRMASSLEARLNKLERQLKQEESNKTTPSKVSGLLSNYNNDTNSVNNLLSPQQIQSNQKKQLQNYYHHQPSQSQGSAMFSQNVHLRQSQGVTSSNMPSNLNSYRQEDSNSTKQLPVVKQKNYSTHTTSCTFSNSGSNNNKILNQMLLHQKPLEEEARLSLTNSQSSKINKPSNWGFTSDMKSKNSFNVSPRIKVASEFQQ